MKFGHGFGVCGGLLNKYLIDCCLKNLKATEKPQKISPKVPRFPRHDPGAWKNGWVQAAGGKVMSPSEKWLEAK